MSVGSSMDSTHDAIHEEAADWFAKRRDGNFNRSEDAAFEAWRSRSDAHARAYAETEHAWEQWKQLQSSARMREMTAAAMKATAPRQRKTSSRRWRPLLAAASLAAIAVVGGIGLLPLMTPTSSVVYSTGLGEQRTERLPDGTRIILNTQTTVQVDYGRRQRVVALRHGEAMFDVVHDAQHPFIVTTTEGNVTDLGTQFLVRDEDGLAMVTLLQGQVEIAAQDEHRQMLPGEQASYGVGTDGIHVHRIDPAAVTGWMHGRLDFSGLPLARAVAEANRYSAIKLRLGDPRLAVLPVGGSFRTGDNAGIAAALSAVFPIRVASSDAHEIVLMPR